MQPAGKTSIALKSMGAEGSLSFNLERMNELEVYSDDGPNSGFKTIQATDRRIHI